MENFVGGSGSACIRFNLFGDGKIQSAFLELPARAQKAVIEPLMTWAAATAADIEKGEAPRATGLLALAIGASPLRKGGSLFITAGVRWGFRRAITRRRNGRRRYLGPVASALATLNFMADPARYVGVLIAGQHSRREVPGDPFMNRAAEIATRTIGQSLSDMAAAGVLREAEKLIS